MAFRIEDFKRTTRKSKDNSPPAVYPHALKDKKDAAKLSRILSLWDANVGRRRGDLDGAALVDFVGDPRLARGIVAVLGQWYKWRTLSIVQAFGEASARLLSQNGIGNARDARGVTYAHVNTNHGGFLCEHNRAAVYAHLAEPYGLTAAQWDDLLDLDSENAQVLTRTSGVPCADDVRAAYNFHAVDTVLKRANSATLVNLPACADPADVRGLARHFGTSVKVGKDGWTFSGGRLGRVVLLVLRAFAERATMGFVDATLGGRVFRMAVTADTNRALGCSFAPSAVSLRKQVEYADVLLAELVKLRTKGDAAGWAFRRVPEAWADAAGVFVPDLRMQRGEQAVWVTMGDAPQWDIPAPVVAARVGRSPSKDAARVAAEATDALDGLFAKASGELPLPVPAGVRELCQKAAAQGLVRAADVQRVLHVPDEGRLTEWFARAGDARVRYVRGVGVVARDLEDALLSRAA